MARGVALTCGCGGYARSCRRLPVRCAPKGLWALTRLRVALAKSLLRVAHASRWGARLTLSEGVGDSR